MANGTAATTPAPDAATLAWKLDGLSCAEAVVLGSIKGVVSGQIVNVVTMDALANWGRSSVLVSSPVTAIISNFRRASLPGCCSTPT
jgi:hypothetical protein